MRTTLIPFLMVLLVSVATLAESILPKGLFGPDMVDTPFSSLPYGCPRAPRAQSSRKTEVFAARLALELGRERLEEARSLLSRVTGGELQISASALDMYREAQQDTARYLTFSKQVSGECGDGLTRAEAGALLHQSDLLTPLSDTNLLVLGE